MNATQLLAHFDRLAEAPNAVPRLRRFILDLAVRGKLVAQDAGDEPASELMKRIQVQKSKGDKRQIAEAKFAAADAPWNVPFNWVQVPLIALGAWAIGAGFPKNEQGVNDGEYFFLKVSDMNLPGNEKYIATSQNSIDADAAKRMRANLHPAGTIIFPKIGGAIATNKRRILTKGSAIDNNCLGITFSREINGDWAYLILTSLDFTQYQVGTAVPALQQAILEQIAIGLPPLAEQHRIVAKVGELMALCDQLEAAQQERERRRDRLAAASLQRLNQPAADTTPEAQREHARFHLHHLPRLTTRPKHIKAMRQTILNLAVLGKLLGQDAHDEPASKLLKRIQTEKARLAKLGRIKAEKVAEPIDHSVGTVPSGWALCRWNSIAMKIGDIDHKMPDTVSDGVPYVSPRDFYPNNVIDFEGAKRISRADYLRLAAKIKPDLDDLIYPRYGTIGENRLVSEQREFLASYSCAVVKTLTGFVDPKYQYIFSISDYCKDQAKAAENKTTQANVGIASIQQYIVPLPPLAEQHRIVAKVDELMALCAQLEAQLTTTQTDSRRLLEAILDAALTPA